MAGKRIEELNRHEPLPHPGWDTFLELDALIDQALGLDLDDEPAFARFCWLMRMWE
jgi:hypothetical protein